MNYVRYDLTTYLHSAGKIEPLNLLLLQYMEY